MCDSQRSHAPPNRDRGGQNTCLDIPVAGVCQSAVSRAMAAGGVRCALVLSKLEKFFKLDS